MSILKIRNPLNKLAKKYRRVFEHHSKQVQLNIDSPDYKKYLDFFISRIIDLESFTELYINYSIPAARRSIKDLKSAIRKAKIESTYFISEDFSENNLQEQLKFGYIGLYHKHEQYTKDLFDLLGLKGNDKTEFIRFIEDKFELFLFKGYKRPESLIEIQWICNKSKHEGTLSTNTEGTPIKFLLANAATVKLNEVDFLAHATFMKDYFLKLLQTLILIKTLKESDLGKFPNKNNGSTTAMENISIIIESQVKLLIVSLQTG